MEDRLLHAEPPSLGILMALEIAQKEARLAAEAEEEGGCLAETEYDSLRPFSSWAAVQQKFLDAHLQSLRSELGTGVEISPLHPDSNVQDQFLNSCRTAGVMPLPAYHGTRSRNISSISSRGLLIPGHGGVTVAHGSAHGLGIYTAVLGASYLSRGFMDSDKLFICGVCDGPDNKAQQEAKRLGAKLLKWTRGISLHHRQHRAPQKTGQGPQSMLGNFRLHKDTGPVRHVGSAMVVFDEARVAPLFLASGVTYPSWTSRVPTFGRGCKVLNLWPSGIPDNVNHRGRSAWVGRRQTLIPETQEVVWLPPEAVRDPDQIRTKRSFECKRKHLRRRKDREEKFAVQQELFSEQLETA